MEVGTCSYCGYNFEDYIYRKRKYCNWFCRSKNNTHISRENIKKNMGKTGEQAPNWRGGVTSDIRGYIRIYTGVNKWQYEHILVAEKAIKRELKPGEVIHHINENKSDNRPENLQVLTKASHQTLHAKGRTYKIGWSMLYEKCILCGTTSIPPQSKGRCQRCYKKLWKANRHQLPLSDFVPDKPIPLS